MWKMSVKYKFKIDRIENGKIMNSTEETLSAESTTIGCVGPVFMGILDRMDEKATGRKIHHVWMDC